LIKIFVIKWLDFKVLYIQEDIIIQILTWNSIDFEQVNKPSDSNFLSSTYDNNSYIRRAQLAMTTVLLILGGLLIVAATGVALYTIYTNDKQIQAALQMAKNQNRQVEIYTSNGYTMSLNVSNTSSFSVAGSNTNVLRIVVYPRNYQNEFIIYPDGSSITPNSTIVEY